MKDQDRRATPEPKVGSEDATRKRFRLEKLEERIAPKGHWNPHTKWVGDGGADGSVYTSGGSIY